MGPFGSGTVFGRQTPGRAIIRVSLWVQRLRLAQLLGSLGGRGAPEWGGMEMFLRQQVPHEDPRMAKVYAHFRANLNDIVRGGQAAGAKVILSTVAVNLRDCPPFASQPIVLGDPPAQAAFARWLQEGEAAAQRGALGEAAAALRQAQTLAGFSGTKHAELSYQLGRCELTLGNGAAARTWFHTAREHDTLRFRADRAINGIISDTAAACGVTVVDAAELLAAQSSNNIPGAEFFYEHGHFTFEGNYQLARALFDAIARAAGGRDERGGRRVPNPGGLRAPDGLDG